MFIPSKSLLAEKLVEKTHLQTIHEGVTFTMTTISDQCWIPILRQLVKRIIKKCYGCKKFCRLRRAIYMQNKSKERYQSLFIVVHQ